MRHQHFLSKQPDTSALRKSLQTMQPSSGSKISRQASTGGTIRGPRHRLADISPRVVNTKADEALTGMDISSSPEMSLPSSQASDEPDSDLELDGYLEKDSVYDWTSVSAHTTTLSLLNGRRKRALDVKELRTSSKRKLVDPEIYSVTRQSYAYWPVEGWSHSRTHSIRKGKVEWKGFPRWVKEEENDEKQQQDLQESPTIRASQKRDESKQIVTQTRSGRVVKRINKDWLVGVSIKKRTRSDPLPTIRRATTPPSTLRLDRGEPNRPQSAMKHKSANKYSCDRDEAMIVITSPCQMPKADTSPLHTPFSGPGASHLHPTSHSQAKTINSLLLPIEDADPDAFSPIAIKAKKVQMSKYILRSRESLPRSDFYQRHKEEEGSPTPEARKREHSVL